MPSISGSPYPRPATRAPPRSTTAVACGCARGSSTSASTTEAAPPTSCSTTPTPPSSSTASSFATSRSTTATPTSPPDSSEDHDAAYPDYQGCPATSVSDMSRDTTGPSTATGVPKTRSGSEADATSSGTPATRCRGARVTSVPCVCLLIVLAQTNPDFPLVVGANRDELLDRPAIPMTVLRESGPRILGGRDE